MVYVEMRLIGPSGGSDPGREPYYEYRMRSDSKEMLVKLTADTFETFYSEVWEKNTYSTIHRSTEIVEQNKPVDDGELLLCDGNGLDVSLRGFPWDRHDEAILVFLNSSDKFQFKMKVEGRETLRINDVSYTCYKVQLALGGFIGSLFPKSYFWYSVDSPHILVRAEAAGMMGDDSYEMELVSYSSAGE